MLVGEPNTGMCENAAGILRAWHAAISITTAATAAAADAAAGAIPCMWCVCSSVVTNAVLHAFIPCSPCDTSHSCDSCDSCDSCGLIGVVPKRFGKADDTSAFPGAQKVVQEESVTHKGTVMARRVAGDVMHRGLLLLLAYTTPSGVDLVCQCRTTGRRVRIAMRVAQ